VKKGNHILQVVLGSFYTDLVRLQRLAFTKKLEEGNYKTKMLLQVHYELVFNVNKQELESTKKLVKTEIEMLIN